jgi:NADH dehydrogenase
MSCPERTEDRGIVVLGGGFAGFWAAVAARRVSGPSVPVRLVSDRPQLVLRPRLYEAAPETLSFGLAEPLASIGVSLVRDRAIELHPHARCVELEAAGLLRYESIVVAIGSRMRRPPVPGASEAYSIDDQRDAVEFDLRLAQIAGRQDVRIAVVGAGFTGIELALELPDRLQSHGRPTSATDPQIVLIDRAPFVGSELGPGPRPVIDEALDAAGVVRWLGVDVTRLGANTVTLDAGRSESFDAVVLCTGLSANSMATPLNGTTDKLGRQHVGCTLRHPEYHDVFFAGDVAAVDTGTGHLALQSCQHALQMGRVAGENAARQRLGEQLIAYHQPDYVTCLDLGPAGAVLTRGWDRNVAATGEQAKAIKQRINRHVIIPELEHGPEGLLAQSMVTRA